VPGPIVHLIIQQRLAAALQREGEGDKLASLLFAAQCDPYAAFGSMGPDYLFFSLKEYGTPLDELTHFIFGAYDALRPLIDFYEDNIEPIVDDVEDAIDAVDDALFGGLFQQLKATSALASGTLQTAVAAGLTSGVDLFYPFYPKIQAGAAESDWYWFDFLHYRRTGEFCSTMWKLAGDDDLRRYCLGYASHIAVDVVGHPFVNTIVGGPYRVHWHRHKLVENWIDAYARNHYPDEQDTKSCLNLGQDDVYIPDAISGSLYYRLVEFPNAQLPKKLAQLIADAMDQVYAPLAPNHPVSMTPGDLDDTYRLWLQWFRLATTVGDMKKPTPVPPPGSATLTLVGDYLSGFPPFPGGPGPPPGGGFNPAAILAALVAFAKWVADAVAYTTDWATNHALDIVTLPAAEAHGLATWLLYQIQKGLWEIYDNVRFALVLGGYIFPEQRDLAKVPWGTALTRSGPVQPRWKAYPRKQEAHSLTGPMEHHLVYPLEPSERPYAEPMPQPFHTQPPEAFITGSWAYNAVIEKLYGCSGPYGATDAFTHTVDSKTWRGGQFGSALDFSARLIVQHIADLPNFNLDGDRGYGWKTWRAIKPDIENQGGSGQPRLDVTDYGIA
jgi:hypothetical protein